MTQEEKMEQLAEVFDVELSSLSSQTALDTLHWDSMAMLSVIAVLKNQYSKKVSGSELRAMRTIQDILDYMN